MCCLITDSSYLDSSSKGGCLITTDVAQNPVMQRQGAQLPPDELHGSNVRGCCNGSNNG